ncbi:MAG: hypothetical protein MUF19_01865 [Candidatus Pacebacteria bacterium]|nr:hypothetical protein [Candidatus Paceibacterota bacterium]
MEKLPANNIEKLPTAEVYVSIANLVRKFVVLHDDGSQTEYYIAIRGKDLDGKQRFQALGGGAKLTNLAKEAFESDFGDSITFRSGEEASDARFYITTPLVTIPNSPMSPRDLPENVLAITDRFSRLDETIIETDVIRELEEELTKLDPSLTSVELSTLETRYKTSVCPVAISGSNTGKAQGADMSFRVFHLFDVVLPEAVFNKLRQSDMLRLLSVDDMIALRKAAESKQSKAETVDGAYLVENLFPEEDPHYQDGLGHVREKY